MNTVEKDKALEAEFRAIQAVKYAAVKLSELNNESYRHIVIGIEGVEKQPQKTLEIIETELNWVHHLVYTNDGKTADATSLTTLVRFLVSEDIDLETLIANIRFTIEQLIMENENFDQFCFSISVEDTKINIADISDCLAAQEMLNFNFFYTKWNGTLSMFSNVLV
jgi:hypothetical protein